VTGVLFVAAIVAAVTAMALRRLRRVRARQAARRRPGATPELAIPVTSWSDMERHLRRRPCPCGGVLRLAGEGSRAVGERRFRVGRLVCDDCEEGEDVYFDTTAVRH
jgi:hypothetical protein